MKIATKIATAVATAGLALGLLGAPAEARDSSWDSAPVALHCDSSWDC